MSNINIDLFIRMESEVKKIEEFIGSDEGRNPKSRFMNLEDGLFYIREKKDDDENSEGQRYMKVSAPICSISSNALWPEPERIAIFKGFFGPNSIALIPRGKSSFNLWDNSFLEN